MIAEARLNAHPSKHILSDCCQSPWEFSICCAGLGPSLHPSVHQWYLIDPHPSVHQWYLRPCAAAPTVWVSVLVPVIELVVLCPWHASKRTTA
jgi:hypothetical protein